MLPTIALSGQQISRLIIGGNPFSGNSHVSSTLDEEMENYFTTERIKATLFRCEACGLNAMQLRADKHILRMMREYRLEGGQMHWIAQTAPEMLSFEANIRLIARNNPAAIYHHGTETDRLFKQGQFAEIVRRLQIMRETGKAVGLGTHMPEVIEYADARHWDLDFYMASVHNLSYADRVSSAVTGLANTGERFEDEDRAVMYRTIRQTPKPCLAFKILGATRKCGSSESVRAAFQEALTNIKPIDAIVVGMFPQDKDQVQENAALVAEILANLP